MIRWLSPWTASTGLHEARIYFQVASLFALYPFAPDGGNMGVTCAILHTFKPGGGIEERFSRLLKMSVEDLPRHLQRVVVLAREVGAPVNWAQLATDLRYWEHPQRHIQMNWAHSFWAGESAGNETAHQSSLIMSPKH